MTAHKTVVITGGGTGGHIYPAISIAQGIRETYGKDVDLVYMGSSGGLEKELVREEGIPFYEIPSGGFLGKGPVQKISGIARTLRGIIRCWHLLRSFRPNLIVGTGGYVTVPVLMAGLIRRVPVAIHEQNVIPGLSNRLAGNFAGSIFVTFDESSKFFRRREKVEVTGLPVRRGFRSGRDMNAVSQSRQLLVTGGSQGSRMLNSVTVASMERLTEMGWKVHLITGKKEYERVIDLLDEKIREYISKGKIVIEPYSQKMDRVLRNSTVVMSRAGASFLAEITCLGVPALLVPLPHSASDHQRHNAYSLQESGAAWVIEEAQLTPEKLSQTLAQLTAEQVEQMTAASLKLGKPRALDSIIISLKKYI